MLFDELNPTAGAGSGATGSPPSSGSGVSGSPPAGSVAAPPAAPAAIDWNTAPEQLRTAYQTTKAEADRLRAEQEKWSKLGDYDQVSNLQAAFSQKLTAATTLGTALGYTAEQVRASMLEDPKGTMAFLQQESARPAVQQQQAEQRRIQDAIDARVKPIEERYDKTLNRDANALFEGERDRLFKADFAKGLPDENRDELFEIFDSKVAGDKQALNDLKFSKQTALLSKHWTESKNTFLKRHNAWIAHERGSGPTPPNGTPPKNGKEEARTSFGMTAKEMFKSL